MVCMTALLNITLRKVSALIKFVQKMIQARTEISGKASGQQL